jgi:hypothetical protein
MARRNEGAAQAAGEGAAPEVAASKAIDAAHEAAAALLVRKMQVCESTMRSCLATWEARKGDEYLSRADFFFDKAVEMADATVRLAEALAKVKGEMRQHIRVQRDAGTGKTARTALRYRREKP